MMKIRIFILLYLISPCMITSAELADICRTHQLIIYLIYSLHRGGGVGVAMLPHSTLLGDRPPYASADLCRDGSSLCEGASQPDPAVGETLMSRLSSTRHFQP